jgi:hypothetical protein
VLRTKDITNAIILVRQRINVTAKCIIFRGVKLNDFQTTAILSVIYSRINFLMIQNKNIIVFNEEINKHGVDL